MWIPTNLAWAAGFIDGEGTFSVYSSGGSIRLTVGQKHREPLDKLVDTFKLGNVTGPDKRGMYTYHVASFPKVQQVFALIYPYLGSVKRKQAINCLNKVKSTRTKWQQCSTLGHDIRTWGNKKTCNTCYKKRRNGEACALPGAESEE